MQDSIIYMKTQLYNRAILSFFFEYQNLSRSKFFIEIIAVC